MHSPGANSPTSSMGLKASSYRRFDTPARLNSSRADMASYLHPAHTSNQLTQHKQAERVYQGELYKATCSNGQGKCIKTMTLHMCTCRRAQNSHAATCSCTHRCMYTAIPILSYIISAPLPLHPCSCPRQHPYFYAHADLDTEAFALIQVVRRPLMLPYICISISCMVSAPSSFWGMQEGK